MGPALPAVMGGHSQSPSCPPPHRCHDPSHDLFLSESLFPVAVPTDSLPVPLGGELLVFLPRLFALFASVLFLQTPDAQRFPETASPELPRPPPGPHRSGPALGAPHRHHPQSLSSFPARLLHVSCLLHAWGFTRILSSTYTSSPSAPLASCCETSFSRKRT